ncbi:MAG: hypothetical protein KDD33_13655, partial [Bdellovibrionales bacterium]|nr:hypothetical protein [Bdellovibrionales bacterium]
NITATRTIAVDVNNATASATADAADSILIYDNSAGGTRKQTRANFLSGYLAASIGTGAGDVMGADAVPNCTAGQKLQMSAGPVYTWSCATDQTGVSDHGALTGLGDDDHAQYALLAGRAGGQSLIGGTASGDDITIESTSNATKGDVILQPNGGNVGIGTASPAAEFHIHNGISLVTDSTVTGALAAINSIPGARSTLSLGDYSSGGSRWRIYKNETAESGSNVGSDFHIRAFNDAGTFLRDALFIKRSTGNVGIGTTSPAATLDISGTDAVIVPQGTTAQRPTGENGMIRYNSSTNKMEAYENGGWTDMIGTGGAGETNTASNVTAGGGVGLFKQKTSSNLEFKSLLAGSTKLSVSSGTSDVTVDVVEANINHDNLAGFVANEHINHASVSVTAGSGLTGGGTIAATRTINVGAGDGIAVAADAVSVDINGSTALGAAVDDADSILIYDSSATAIKKATRAELVLSESEVDAYVADNGYAADSAVLKKDGSVALTGNWNIGGVSKITNMPAPSAASDAATKGYVDGHLGGLTMDLTGLANGQSVRWNNGLTKWEVFTPAAGGEANVGANVGAGTGQIYRDKTGTSINFKTIAAGSSKLSIANNSNDVTLDVVEANIDHDALSNFVANEHVDHSAVSVTAGNGLTGGGTIASTRTIHVGAGTGISVAANTVDVDVNNATAETVINAADSLLIYDASATATRKMTRANFLNGYLAASIGTSAGDVMGADAVPNCTAGQKLQMSAGPTYVWSCVTDQTGANTVGSSEVVDNSLTASDLAAGSVGTSEIANGSVAVADLNTTSIDARYVNLSGDDMTGALSSTGNIQAGKSGGGVAMTINDGFGNANLTFNHVSGIPEQNGNAARIEVNTDAVTTATMDFELKDNVTSGVAVGLNSIMRLQSDGKVGINTISPSTALEVSGTVTATAFAGDGSALTNIAASSIAANSVGSSEVIDNSLTASDLAANSVGASEISAGAVGTSEIANGSIAAADIGTDVILASNIAAGAVTTSEILDGTIATADIAANAITSALIAADTIVAGDIATNGVGAAEIA